MTEKSPEKICPFCPNGKTFGGRAIYMHVRHHHPEELETQGWDAIRAQTKNVPKPIYNPAEAKKDEPEKPTEDISQEPEDTAQQELAEAKTQEGKETSAPLATPDKGMDALMEQTRKLQGFYPVPAATVIINACGDPAHPSAFINEAVINEGKRRGMAAAIITTPDGQSMELMKTGKDNSDQDFDRLIKLLTVSATVNQSYSPNTPLIQMIQAVKDSKRGMPMQEFMQQLIMLKELEREPNKQGNMMIPFMFMSRFRGAKR